MAKLRQSRAKSEKEAEKYEEKLQEIVAEQKSMEQDALLVINAVEAAKEKMLEKERELKIIAKDFNDIKAIVARIKSVEVDLQVEVDRNLKEKSENEEVAGAWSQKLEVIQKEHREEQLEFLSAVQTVSPPGVSAVAPVADIETLPILTTEMLQLAVADVDDLKREINVLEAEKERYSPSLEGITAHQQCSQDERECEHERSYRVLEEGCFLSSASGGARGHHRAAQLHPPRVRGPPSTATGRVHGRLQRYHTQAQRDVPNDYPRRRCRARAGRFARSLFRGNRILCSSAEEELEEHLKLVRRRKDLVIARPRLRVASLQTNSSLCHGRDRRRAGMSSTFHLRDLIL